MATARRTGAGSRAWPRTSPSRSPQGDAAIFGVMMESFLVEGRQDLGRGRPRYGQSITDACLGWEVTVPVLRELADAVRARRRLAR